MSTTVRSYGVIAILAVSVSDEARDELGEKFYSDKSDLGINYEGSLVYLDFNKNKRYSEREEFYGLSLGRDRVEGIADPAAILTKECNKYGLVFDTSSIDTYNCIWYNGSDNPVDNLTLDQFKARSLGY